LVATAFIIGVFLIPNHIMFGQESSPDSQPEQEATGVPIDIIDAQAFSPNRDGRIDGDPSEAVNATWMRNGVFADGTSVLVLRFAPTVVDNQDITFTIRHTNGNKNFPQTADYVGSLSATFPTLPAPDAGTGTGTTSVTIKAGNRKIVYYRPPNNFLFGRVPLTQNLQISAVTGGQTISTTTFNLVRPTIVLSHGFMSNSTVMFAMQGYLTGGGRLARILLMNWSTLNTSGLDTVPIQVQNTVATEVQWQRNRGIAATRVDFFGHSMGGVIVKWYASNMGNINQPRNFPQDDGFPNLIWPGALHPYLRADNFGVGDIRRLVSVGSPYQGSPIADYASAFLGYDTVLLLLSNTPGMAGDTSAVNDLGVTGRAMSILNAQHPIISWYPIVGIGAAGKTQADLVNEQLAFLLNFINTSPAQMGLLANNSDFVVQDSSQVSSGAFPPRGISYGVVNSVTHLDEPGSLWVSPHLLRALDLAYTSPADADYVSGYTLFNSSF
jgi:hypothetical protein